MADITPDHVSHHVSSDADGTESHGVDHPHGQPGSKEYISWAKSKIMQDVDDGDQIGEDANYDNQYASHSLDLGGGGRWRLLVDRISWTLVQDGYSLEEARDIAHGRARINYSKKYGGGR